MDGLCSWGVDPVFLGCEPWLDVRRLCTRLSINTTQGSWLGFSLGFQYPIDLCSCSLQMDDFFKVNRWPHVPVMVGNGQDEGKVCMLDSDWQNSCLKGGEVAELKSTRHAVI